MSMNVVDARRVNRIKLVVRMFVLLAILQLVLGVLEADVAHNLVLHIALAIAFALGALAQRENMVRAGCGLEIVTIRNVRRLNAPADTPYSASAFRWTVLSTVGLLLAVGALVLYFA
jgi:hypothetical protein